MDPAFAVSSTTEYFASYNCNKGYATWEVGWSLQKKAWCCENKNLGCPPAPALFDCSSGFSNWQTNWSPNKKEWCCQHKSKGCTTTTAPYNGPFDCSAGYGHWQFGWSSQKKDWCCEKEMRGCVTSTSTATASTTMPQPHHSGPFDCNAGYANWMNGWSPSKKRWCCQHEVKGCTTTAGPSTNPYDCSAGFTDWEIGWSPGKKLWCCRHQTKGCTTKAAHVVATTSQVAGMAFGSTLARQPSAVAQRSEASSSTTKFCVESGAATGDASGRPCSVQAARTTPETATAPTTQLPTTTTGPTTTTFPPGSLYCFALMQPVGYELLLLQLQWKKKAGIFECDEPAILSSRVVDVAPGLKTRVVDSDLKCTYGGEFMTALNTDIFMAVWKKVIEDGRYSFHAWTIKVDPDCVFFPIRLKEKLKKHPENSPAGVYLNNCKYGLHGPIEIFSKNAVRTWDKGRQRCVDHFNKQCNGPCAWGEDLFIDQCLWKVLNVRRDNDSSILTEDHCDPKPGWNECKDRSYVAFHPFKTVDGFKQCLNNTARMARAADQPGRHYDLASPGGVAG
eukprot:CAMPEP_0179131874 /NCGR_PEP_ID=MMETSP0796-20121207/62660_1 /TAXON_ID=73915 /ORGANISM="Pyrodinium bahamense, Strain pbaha01" /LENGTH=560 /DNA_ID=CAMNT_0020830809 /DNA_START=124 /DNA_END=1807 /DNA_ORIENTATION=+